MSDGHVADPRARLLVAIILAVGIALLSALNALLTATAGALVLSLATSPDWPLLRRRLLPLNALMALLLIILPWSWQGDTPHLVGGLPWHAEGFRAALRILLKANAILLLTTSLTAHLSDAQLGQAMQGLRVPRKLVLLLVLTLRYIALLRHELQRLRLSMRARCFRPRLDLHTLRSYGQLTGMLLVRGHARSERVLQAMRCRGFDGHFRTLHRGQWQAADTKLLLFSALAVSALHLL